MLAAALFLFITACNRGSDDPHVGRWNAVSITALGLTVDVGEAFVRETSLLLRDNGNSTVTIDGNSTTGQWSIYGGIVRVSAGGQNFTGLIDHENGYLILYLPGHGMEVNFVHQDGNIVPQPREPEPEPPPGGWRSSNPREWWYGEWFGFMTVNSELEDGSVMRHKWDAFAVSNAIEGHEMFVYIWDVGLVIGRPTFSVDFYGGTGDRGIAVASGGQLLGGIIEPGSWSSDPELSLYRDQFVIDVRHELDDGGYVDYQIVLRPWGMLWDDVPVGGRPPAYDRYLELYRRPLSEADIPDRFE